ncbi:MAG: hypothetical protein N2555_03420, partial [Endomicrobia bacterium]|nr:hypothetical protein [Endomicrobiia bacterium]
MIDILKYYKSSIVQQRMSEYCGSKDVDPSKFTCEYLVGVKEKITNNEFYLSVENDKFFWLLEIGADIFRTVWDREATLFILDFEYYNIAYPAEAYFKPYDVFYK